VPFEFSLFFGVQVFLSNPKKRINFAPASPVKRSEAEAGERRQGF